MIKYEVYFQSEETLEKVLDECKESFDRIDNISQELRSSIFKTKEDTGNILQELGGIFGFLNPIYKISITEKENRQERFFSQIKIETEEKGDKFTATSGEKESSLRVANYRRIRNIIEAYIETIKTQIGICQSILKSLEEERNFTK